MWFDNNVPGEPDLGGIYPIANDLFVTTLGLMGGKRGLEAFYRYHFVSENHTEIFK